MVTMWLFYFRIMRNIILLLFVYGSTGWIGHDLDDLLLSRSEEHEVLPFGSIQDGIVTK